MTPVTDAAIASADIIVTETGAVDVLTADHLGLIKDGAILLNGGHFPSEIDFAGMAGSAEKREGAAGGCREFDGQAEEDRRKAVRESERAEKEIRKAVRSKCPFCKRASCLC